MICRDAVQKNWSGDGECVYIRGGGARREFGNPWHIGFYDHSVSIKNLKEILPRMRWRRTMIKI